MKKLERMRMPEVTASVRDGDRVFVPLGATEQHGPHGPYCTDTLLATAACDRIAERIGGVVAPAVPYGLSGDHHGFPGIPYLSIATFTGVIQDLAKSLVAGGFSSVVFVNGHYSNVMAISAAISEVGDQIPGDALVFGFNYWDTLEPEQLAEYISPATGLHANVGETSATLAVDPDLVDMDSAVREFPEFPIPPTPSMVSSFFFTRSGMTRSVLDSGVWGDPTVATAEKGEVFLDQIAAAGSHFVETIEGLHSAYPRRSLEEYLKTH